MMSFAWRWAQVGDRVTVHEVDFPHRLLPAVVTHVRRAGQHTFVAVRADGQDGRVEYVARQYVHPVPMDASEECPLCTIVRAEGTVAVAETVR